MIAEHAEFTFWSAQSLFRSVSQKRSVHMMNGTGRFEHLKLDLIAGQESMAFAQARSKGWLIKHCQKNGWIWSASCSLVGWHGYFILHLRPKGSCRPLADTSTAASRSGGIGCLDQFELPLTCVSSADVARGLSFAWSLFVYVAPRVIFLSGQHLLLLLVCVNAERVMDPATLASINDSIWKVSLKWSVGNDDVGDAANGSKFVGLAISSWSVVGSCLLDDEMSPFKPSCARNHPGFRELVFSSDSLPQTL